MLSRFRPTRDDKNVEVCLNLDKLISDPVYFELGGKRRKLNPITTEQYYKFVNASAKFKTVLSKEDPTPEEVFESFAVVFNSVCDDIGLEDVKKMNQIQLGALYKFVIKHTQGESHVLDEDELKKKTLAIFKT